MAINSVISYHFDARAEKKTVVYRPVDSTDTLQTGYIVCYNNDITENVSGVAVPEGETNAARSYIVEKPTTANVKFIAGIVADESGGAVAGDTIVIYVLNGADMEVFTSLDCTNGTTELFAANGSYIAVATASGAMRIGLAKQTVNRSGTNGIVYTNTDSRTVV